MATVFFYSVFWESTEFTNVELIKVLPRRGPFANYILFKM